MAAAAMEFLEGEDLYSKMKALQRQVEFYDIQASILVPLKAGLNTIVWFSNGYIPFSPCRKSISKMK